MKKFNLFIVILSLILVFGITSCSCSCVAETDFDIMDQAIEETLNRTVKMSSTTSMYDADVEVYRYNKSYEIIQLPSMDDAINQAAASYNQTEVAKVVKETYKLSQIFELNLNESDTTLEKVDRKNILMINLKESYVESIILDNNTYHLVINKNEFNNFLTGNEIQIKDNPVVDLTIDNNVITNIRITLVNSNDYKVIINITYTF